MFVASFLISQIGGVVLGTLAARRTHRRVPEVTLETVHRHVPALRTGIGVVFVMAVPLIATLSDDLARRLPLLLQRHVNGLTWSLTLAGLATTAGFSVAMALRTSHLKRRSLLLAVLLLLPALNVCAWRRVVPIAAGLDGKQTIDGIVLQSSDASCAAASVANVARLVGRTADERLAAELIGTTRYGSSPGQIRFALDALGIAFEEIDSDDLDAVTPPAILFVAPRSAATPGEHAVVYAARREDGYEIWDPLTGRIQVPPGEARHLWKGGGLACRPR